jgi:hypothetical protein
MMLIGLNLLVVLIVLTALPRRAVLMADHEEPGRTEFNQKETLVGNWTGESICQVKDSPCHDEKVMYHISNGNDPDHVMVSADKIVDGKAINMGGGNYIYDRKSGTLLNENEGRVWRFTVKGNSMTGTLTMPDKTIYRRVTLRDLQVLANEKHASLEYSPTIC